MPRKGRGPHLWLHPERRDEAGRTTHAAIWYIKDGGFRQSTKCAQTTLQELSARFNDTSTESTRSQPSTSVIPLKSP
jgi:hypothetical protein